MYIVLQHMHIKVLLFLSYSLKSGIMFSIITEVFISNNHFSFKKTLKREITIADLFRNLF